MIYSLKNETAVHIWRFGSAILKFQTSISNPQNKAIVLLSDGIIQSINLKSMSTEVSLPTYFINSDQILQRRAQSNLSAQLGLADRHLLVQLASSLPKYFDMSSDCYAYIFSSINQPDSSEQWRKTVDDSLLGRNLYAKEVAGKAVNIGHQVLSKVDNLFNVQKATTMDVHRLQEQLSGSSSKRGSNTLLNMMGTAGAGNEVTQLNDEEYYQDKDFRRRQIGNKGPFKGIGSSTNEQHMKQLQDLTQTKAKVEKENKIKVQIRDLKTHRLVAEIEPPFFDSISVLKFSPSGRYLLIGNQDCQCFYIYEIFPASCLRVHGTEGGPNSTNMAVGIYPTSCQETVRLQYSLFRGNTIAKVTDV